MNLKKTHIIRIHVDRTWSAKVPLFPASTATLICKSLGQKDVDSSRKFVKRFLYIAARKTSNSLSSHVLRQLRPDEDVFALEQELNAKLIPHEYHALSEQLYNGQTKVKQIEYDVKFFKKGKWEQVGEMQKFSKMRQKFYKRSFYLGSNILYCINKGSKNYWRTWIENFKVKPLELSSLAIREEVNKKENIMRVEIAHSKTMKLKVSNVTEYKMWYNNILCNSLNSRIKLNIKLFNKAIEKLERETASLNEEDIDDFFSEAERIFNINESREILFEELTAQRPEIGYLCVIYDLISKYKNFCMLNQNMEALKEARKIHNIASGFYTNETTNMLRNPMKAEMMSINNEISKVINEVFPKELQKNLAELNNAKDTQSVSLNYNVINQDVSLFKELERNIVAKITSLYKDIEKKRTNSETASKLLSIPAIQFKNSLKNPPNTNILGKIVNIERLAKVAVSSKINRSMTIMIVKNGFASKTIARKGLEYQGDSEEFMNL